MLLTHLLRGLATYIPRPNRVAMECEEGTVSARYCYSVWLRHLVMADQSGLLTAPSVVAELGPGDSIGTGLAALLSGVKQYYAFDVVRYVRTETNRSVLEELIELFSARAPIPNEDEFPKVEPRLRSYDFPRRILTEERLRGALQRSRLEAIRRAISLPDDPPSDEVRIRYLAPWNDPAILEPGSVDMIYSQAVLEHVDDLVQTYRTLHSWLRLGGFMSHAIDFKCHGTADHWNGHWTYSDWVWKVVRGKRTYLINRQPHSVHFGLMRTLGFEILCDVPNRRGSEVGRNRLAAPFRGLSEDDLEMASAFIIAVKKV